MSSDSTVYKKTVCPLDCPDSCGMIAKVENGRVVSLVGDPDHPYTNGFICRKMKRYPERVYGEERIRYPLLRTGKKGEGKFKRISWPEALKIFADKIRTVKSEYGGEAILPFQYAGNMGVLNRNGGYALYHKLGTSRLIETICSAAAGAAWSMHCGSIPGTPPEVAAESSLVIAWGINVRVSNVHFWQYMKRAKSRGAKLVVIDPYKNETAALADHHIRVLPGGDGALALGVLKQLIFLDTVDKEFISAHTTGFDELVDYVGELGWDTIVSESGVSVDDIQWLAGLLIENPATFIRIGIGLSRNSRGGASVRSIACLGAALGLFDGAKGRGLLYSSKAFNGDSAKLRFPELMEKETRFINMAHLGHALTSLEPSVKLFIVYSSNPLSVAPDASRVREGLLRDDLFTVVHEQVMTPTARYADLLLPATTFLENRDLYTGYGHFYMGHVDRVIEPVGEAVSNFDLFQSLAKELGYTDEPFLQTAEDRMKSYVVTMKGLPPGYTFDASITGEWIASERLKGEGSVFKRFDSKFRFVSSGSAAITRVPQVTSGLEFGNYDYMSRFPLKLITPPHKDMLNSTFGERFKGELGSVLIHPEDASRYGIIDGGRVMLENSRGKTLRTARITEDTSRGLVVAEGIYWQVEPFDDLSGINNLTSQKTTDVGAGPTFHESRVAVKMIDNE